MERQTLRQKYESAGAYMVDVVLGALESDEDQTPSEELEANGEDITPVECALETDLRLLPFKLTLEITDCGESTRRALERQVRRQGYASINDYCAEIVLGMLETDEEHTPAADLEEGKAPNPATNL